MNWSDIAPIIGAVAPTAGKILGGFIPFPGGALIGEQFGKIIARQFGVAETPDAVKEAMAKANGDVALAKIAAATEEARAKIEGFVRYETAVVEAQRANAEQVNQTMQVEVLPENRHWFFTGWRAAAGWVLVVFLAALGVLAAWASVQEIRGHTGLLQILAAAWPLYVSILVALGAVVGVYIRSPDRPVTTVVSGPPPGPPAPPPTRKLPR